MNEIEKIKKKLDSTTLNVESLAQWVLVEHEGKNISQLMYDMGYKTIGIYGYGYIGKLLYKVLDKNIITVACIIDKVFEETDGICMSLKDDLPAMDLIVITSAYYYNEIREEIERKGVSTETRLLDEFLFQM